MSLKRAFMFGIDKGLLYVSLKKGCYICYRKRTATSVIRKWLYLLSVILSG